MDIFILVLRLNRSHCYEMKISKVIGKSCREKVRFTPFRIDCG